MATLIPQAILLRYVLAWAVLRLAGTVQEVGIRNAFVPDTVLAIAECSGRSGVNMRDVRLVSSSRTKLQRSSVMAASSVVALFGTGLDVVLSI